ncbi:MAG: MacB family efflux pump subunit [Desulfovibrionaceae bacterium]|nr:MacB family efflux pump subunit [Desulfovibrionaceae bacterium]
MSHIIEMKNICRWFGNGAGRVQVLKDISLTIEDGDFVAIIGQSGSGKSTLMNIIGCLDTQTSGTYRIDGKDTSALSPDDLADLRSRYIGFIFQKYNLLPSLSALDNTALPAVYAGYDRKTRLDRAVSLLNMLGLEGKAANRPSELSGGQQQRVSIARALMNGGRLILADEPTGALDSGSGENVMKILCNLHAQGHTVVVVTHDAKVASYASRIIEIRDGTILSDTRKSTAAQPQKGANSIKSTPRSAFGRRSDQLRESLSMSIQAILSHKLRSLLTMLGIIIGIASVVSVVALGKGSQDKIVADISSMGTNTIDIFPGKGFGDRYSGKIRTLTVDDAEILGKQSYIDSITPNTSKSGDLVLGNTTLTAQLNGVGEQYFAVKAYSVAQGRLFTNQEVRQNASYAVLDDNTFRKLFPQGGNAIGQIVLFNRKPLIIIGVLAKKSRSFGPESELLRIFTPYTTAISKFTGNRHITSITAKISDNCLPFMAEKNLTALLTARHGKQDFYTINTDSIRQTIESTIGVMRLLISGIAVISLVVGGIGVMNIMLVSVTERTREIGIRIAVGAKRMNIMEQFLIEAVLLCLAGGLLGIGLSAFIGFLFSMLVTKFTFAYSAGSVFAALFCSSGIGILFGFIPARNASRLNPIDALSQE